MLAIEGSDDTAAGKKVKADPLGKEIAGCAACWALAATDRPGSSGKQYCKIHRTKGHDLQNCRQVELLAKKQKAEYERRDKEKDQDGAEGSGKKQWAREITAAEPLFDAQTPLKWPSTPLILDAEDHPDRTTPVGCLPLLVSPTIRNLRVNKMLVHGGAGLNLISPVVIKKMQILMETSRKRARFKGSIWGGASRGERSHCS